MKPKANRFLESPHHWPLLIAAALCVWALQISLLTEFHFFFPSTNLMPHEAGEALLHGLRADGRSVNAGMPLFTLMPALTRDFLPEAGGYWLTLSIFSACAALVFVIGCLLQSASTGLVGLVFFAALIPDFTLDRAMEYWLMLAIALAAVRRARAPSPGRSFLLGLAVAASLLYKSSMLLLVFLLAAYDWAQLARRTRSERLRIIAPLVVTPCVLLLPWIRLNWLIEHRLMIFENARYVCNVVTGVLGFVPTIHDGQGLVQLPPGASVLGWAAGEVLRHPLRYVGSCLSRAAFVFTFSPALLLLALASFWKKRGEGHRQLGLFTAYFLGIHCLMSVERRYFLPLWPLVALLGACFLAERPKSYLLLKGLVLLAAFRLLLPLDRHQWLPAWPIAALLTACFLAEAPAPPHRATERLARIATACSAAASAVLIATALFFVSLYPGRISANRDGLESAMSRWPRCASLWSEKGRREMQAARPDLASAAFARALSLEPDDDSLFDLSWALAAKGGKSAALIDRARFVFMDTDFQARTALLKGLVSLENGKPRAADLQFALAEEATGGYIQSARPPANAAEADAVSALRARDVRCGGHLARLLAAWPPERRELLLDGLERLRPFDSKLKPGMVQGYLKLADDYEALHRSDRALRLLRRLGADSKFAGGREARFWIFAGSQEAKLGHRDAAKKALARARALNPGPDELRRISQIEGGGPKEPTEVPAPGSTTGPAPESTASYWLERASSEIDKGRRLEALNSLARAQALAPSPDQTRIMADLYPKIDEDKKALAALDRIKGAAAQTADLWLARAGLQAKGGDRDAALRSLAAATASRPTSDERRRAALLFQDLQENGKAFEIFQALTRESPRNAELLCDRGLSQYLNGRVDAAAADLNAALKLDPHSLTAALNLGAIYTQQRRYAAALKLYDAALAAPANAKTRDTRRQIAENKREVQKLLESAR